MRGRGLLAASPGRALVEAWMLGLLVLFGLSRLVGQVSPNTLNNGMLMLCGLSGMWTVLRARLPAGSVRRQVFREVVVAAALSAAMLALRLPGRAFGLEADWARSSWNLATVSALLAATGMGYFDTRLLLRILLIWDGLRRRRLVWSLTNAHLVVVALAGVLGAVVLFLISPYARGVKAEQIEQVTPLVRLARDLLLTVFPTLGIMAILIGMALAVVLPPSALFSYLVARQTTRRLEALTSTAQAVRDGDYTARAIVRGEDEVARLQADFNAMADELSRTLGDLKIERDTVARLLEARREMIAGVSHELRTPVATVRALLESVLARRENEPPASLMHDLEIVDCEMARLQGLIDDLFLLARAEAGGLELDCGPTDVASIILSTVAAMAPLAWQVGRVELFADAPTDLPAGRANPARLGQLLANLIRNAVVHTEPGGIVAVSARGAADAVTIEVRDTGKRKDGTS